MGWSAVATAVLLLVAGNPHGGNGTSPWPRSRRAPASPGQLSTVPLRVTTQDTAAATVVSDARLELRPLEDLVGQALGAHDAADRGAAIDAIAYAAAGDPDKSGYATWVLTQALTDPDERVRAQALATLKDTADVLPLEALGRLVREDPSTDRRIQALELLVERAGADAHEPLRIALGDPDAWLSARAGELIVDWHIELEGG